MNSRAVIAGVVIAVGLSAAGLWLQRRAAHPEVGSGDPAALAKASQTPADGVSRPETLPSPGDQPSRTEQTPPPAPAPAPLEIVEPMLELNLAADLGSGGAELPAEGNSVDELLSAKHFGKSKSQLQVSYDSIAVVLQLQRDPNQIPKDKILSPQALSALGIEQAWLKEQLTK